MKKEIHTTPIILIMALFLTLIIVLLQSAAFVTFKAPHHEPGRKKGVFAAPSDLFTDRIFSIVQPDSAQSRQIRFFTNQTAERIKRLHHHSRQERRQIMDSLRQQLKPILTDDQFKRLESMALYPNRNDE